MGISYDDETYEPTAEAGPPSWFRGIVIRVW